MKYNQPYGVTDPNAAYINGDPSAGIAGSIPPAASIEFPQREIVNFLTDSGLVPTNSDLHQLAESVQSGRVVYGVDQGPANAVSIALTPILLNYIDGMTFRVLVANSNTGPATFNAGPGPVNIVRRGGGNLQAGDMPAAYQSFLTYNALHNNVELYGASFQAQTLVPILAANSNLYVNHSTGDDTLYDGTSATISGSHGPFKTIMRAINETFKYGPSVYTMTIHVAAGTYAEAVATPRIIGPAVVINGNGIGSTIVTGANSQHTFSVIGGNQVTIRNLTSVAQGGVGGPSCFNAANGGTLVCENTASGSAAAGYIFNAYGGYLYVGTHLFGGGSVCQEMFSAFVNGFIFLEDNAALSVGGAVSAQGAVAVTSTNGSILVPSGSYTPSWGNPGAVSGYKYFCDLNGVINTNGLGVNWFPGNIAGYVQRGGQYG